MVDQNELGGRGVWIDNNSLIYGDTVDNKTAIFYLNHEKVLLEQTLVPDVYVSSENIVFTLGSNKRHEFNLGSAETMSTSFSYAPYDYSDFTKQKLTHLKLNWQKEKLNIINIYKRINKIT